MPGSKSQAIDTIVCTNMSKRFMYEWVIRDFTFTFQINKCYGLRGPNGSGKSTLIRMLSGFSTPSKGSISFLSGKKKISISDVFSHVTIAAPYIELIDEMTVSELFTFHHGLRPFDHFDEAIKEVKELPFNGIMGKRVDELSSGMKQRIKLLLTLMTKASIILLDEPGSNLDLVGKKWFEELLIRNKADKIVIIASNEEDDLTQAEEFVSLPDYK